MQRGKYKEETETNELYGLAWEQITEDKKVSGHISSLDESVA